MGPETAKCDTQRRPVSDEIADRARKLATQAVDLSSRVESKLNPVMRAMNPEPAPPASGNITIPRRLFPPLFEELRDALDNIEASMITIDEYLQRTEL